MDFGLSIHTVFCLCSYSHCEHRWLSDALLNNRGLHIPPLPVTLLRIKPDGEIRMVNLAAGV